MDETAKSNASLLERKALEVDRARKEIQRREEAAAQALREASEKLASLEQRERMVCWHKTALVVGGS